MVPFVTRNPINNAKQAPASHREARKPSAALADIILGGQDGLVNTLGVILGVAAASSDPRIVIAAGLAATFAESISMGAVAYTATLAEHDHYRVELERERREIREMPEAEAAEVRAIFAGWGLSGPVLEAAVAQVIQDEDAWLDVMMRNELKLAPIENASAFRIALVVGFSAVVGSLIPLAPFLLLPLGCAVPAALVLCGLALFGVGVYKARLTVGRPVRSGVQMAVIGIVSALAGYAIGALFQAPVTP
ncbi:MAG: VIT1/CCC1 transporter family protein [Anaerolineales bacterium]|nr:VIT1/CCC1 transporter family protein [Anaerolineales bacterium]